MATGAQWRVGDAEREAVAGQLREHYAAGRLSIDEFRARLDAAYAARTADQLTRVTADLPAAGPGPAAGPVLAGPVLPWTAGTLAGALAGPPAAAGDELAAADAGRSRPRPETNL